MILKRTRGKSRRGNKIYDITKGHEGNELSNFYKSELVKSPGVVSIYRGP